MLNGLSLQLPFPAIILHFQLTMYLSPLRKKGTRIQHVLSETRCLSSVDSILHLEAVICKHSTLASSIWLQNLTGMLI